MTTRQHSVDIREDVAVC